MFKEFIDRDFLDALNCDLDEATRFYNENELGLVKCLISHAERAPRLSECQTSKMLRHSMTI